ncbi:hypothetical protein ABFX02_02G060300 [Erythranthe guttata]
MSDLCSYEFEDIVWDDFCQSDDHIVPHPGSGRADHSALGDSHKKPRHEAVSISNGTGDKSSAAYGDQGSEQGGFSSLSKRRSTMLENDSYSPAPSAVLPSPSDSDANKDTSSLASENTTSSSPAFKSNNADSNHSEFCVNDAILGEQTSAVDNNSFTDTLGDITLTGSNLDFFENREGKDSSDMLYYGWPEIGNFEDVDTMFRSCDSAFGLAAMKDDEFGWFPSADNIGESGDIVKPDFKFPYGESNPVKNISQNHNSSSCSSANDSTMTYVPTRFNHSSWTSEKSDSCMSFVNGPAMANSEDGFIPRQQMMDHKKQVKLQNQSTGKRKEHYFGDNSNYMSNLSNEVVQLPLSFMHSDSSPWSDLTSVNPTTSVVKSETYDLTSPSPRDSSHASNQSQSSFDDPKFPLAAPEQSGRREKLHTHQGSLSSAYSNKKKASGTVQAVTGDTGTAGKTGGKQVCYSRDDSDSHRGTVGFSPLIPIELGPSDIQERSMSLGMDDTSLEAASFRQLQLVMEQLDLRTKMCIRDSLYRLARSAEQRSNHLNLNGSCGDEREASKAFMGEGPHNSFMDIETDTNPIDRSIAHLLFHRPSESSAIPVHDSSLPVHGPTESPPVMVEDLVSCDETATMMEKVSDDTDCKC